MGDTKGGKPMKRYKLNRARFAEFLLEVGTMAGTAALLVWVVVTWIATA